VRPGLLVPLADARRADAGGKAAALAALLRLGVAVPDGWVVTALAYRLLRSGELSGGAFDAAVLGRLRADGREADQRFAVRSSADAEDSAEASYAGQFRTELNVPRDEVPAAVRRVAASARNASALTYARRLGVRPPRAMAVLVQEQLDPFLSGVCLTVHPVTGAPAAVLEYAHGLGDTVASGAGHAGSHVLPRLPGGGFDWAPLASVSQQTAYWLRAVVLLAARLEEELAGPLDIEWAVDRRGLWAVQVRPVTAVGRRAVHTRDAV
jgi:phosphoenolpyruvate synthase/pyruvate phosphate dikinase